MIDEAYYQGRAWRSEQYDGTPHPAPEPINPDTVGLTASELYHPDRIAALGDRALVDTAYETARHMVVDFLQRVPGADRAVVDNHLTITAMDQAQLVMPQYDGQHQFSGWDIDLGANDEGMKEIEQTIYEAGYAWDGEFSSPNHDLLKELKSQFSNDELKSMVKTSLTRRGVLLFFNKDIFKLARVIVEDFEDESELNFNSDAPLSLKVISGIQVLTETEKTELLAI